MVMNKVSLYQLLHVSTTPNGASLMVYNHLDMHIELLSMKKRSLLLAEATISESEAVADSTIQTKNFRHTEIWSLDGESYNIKLAQPKLMEYFYYPELFVVDADYCVTK